MGKFMYTCCIRNEHISQIKGAQITRSAFENLVYFNMLSFCVNKYSMKDYAELHKHKIPENSRQDFLSILNLLFMPGKN